jgi:hypothetical protein
VIPLPSLLEEDYYMAGRCPVEGKIVTLGDFGIVPMVSTRWFKLAWDLNSKQQKILRRRKPANHWRLLSCRNMCVAGDIVYQAPALEVAPSIPTGVITTRTSRFVDTKKGSRGDQGKSRVLVPTPG